MQKRRLVLGVAWFALVLSVAGLIAGLNANVQVSCSGWNNPFNEPCIELPRWTRPLTRAGASPTLVFNGTLILIAGVSIALVLKVKSS